jgi:hypothetical protein
MNNYQACIVLSERFADLSMASLRRLPEFVSGQGLARAGKWTSAKADFARCVDVMRHSNNTRDCAIGNLYAASCAYFGGKLDEARNMFVSAEKSSQYSYNDPLGLMSRRYSFSTTLMSSTSSEQQSLLYRAKDSSDMWTHLTANIEPPMGSFAREIWEYTLSGGQTKVRDPGNSAELIGLTHGLLSVAEARIDGLPKANATGMDISELVDKVTVSLRSAENIGKDGSEDLKIISRFFISRSLILRGRLFEFNANALMAEGMYRAAMDISASRITPRLRLVSQFAQNHLGDLLLKWEKREPEGEQLKKAIVLPEGADSFLRRFIIEPTFDELDKLE